MEAKLKDGKYCYPLRLEGSLQDAIKRVAKQNRHTINDEISIAVENHVAKELKKIKK